MTLEVIGAQLLDFGTHPVIAGRVTGTVKVKIRETFMGNETEYELDLPVKADCASDQHDHMRTALLTHAAHQLNRLKARHEQHEPLAAE